MRAPDFWGPKGGPLLPALLSPLSAIYGFVARRRYAAGKPWRAPVPVLCVGNLVAGGAGKTPVALDVGARLAGRGAHIHFLIRGYGGTEPGPHRVDPAADSSRRVGDEALLLAAQAPTWVAADRAAGAMAAVSAGAGAIVMDDGYQNPGLAKDLSFLVVDAAYGFGNGRVLPAGPLRERPEEGLARADAVVLLDPEDEDAELEVRRRMPKPLPILVARTQPGPEVQALAGQKALAFAGIGRPAKFFAMLAASGVTVEKPIAFSDHYPYADDDIREIKDQAARWGAVPVTTAKDLVRVPPALRGGIRVVGLRLVWEDEAALVQALSPVAARC